MAEFSNSPSKNIAAKARETLSQDLSAAHSGLSLPALPALPANEFAQVLDRELQHNPHLKAALGAALKGQKTDIA